MTISELIEKLSEFPGDKPVQAVVANYSYEFSLSFGGGEGCTKQTCDWVSLYVDDTCQNEAAS